METRYIEMSEDNKARRTEIYIDFKNIDVPAKIDRYITSLVYTDEAGDKSDDLQVVIDDRERIWLSNWMEVHPKGVTTSKTIYKLEEQEEKVINYVVQKGETLFDVATKVFGNVLRYNQISAENNIANSDLIYPGQVLKITLDGEDAVKTVEATAEQISETKLISATIIQKNWNDDGKDKVLDCGVFEVDSVDVSGPPTKLTIKGTSTPYTSTIRSEKKSRAWENIGLKEIAGQMAQEAGLKLMYTAVKNPTYKRKEQIQTSDIAFLEKLCVAAGMKLKVTMLAIVVYDAEEYEKNVAVRTIEYGGKDYISYKMSTSMTDTAYTSCHVSYTDPATQETIESTYTPDGTSGTGQKLEINEKVTSTEEAQELAKKRLREKNTQQVKASFHMLGDVGLVAGMTVKLKGFWFFDKKYIIEKATHNLTGGYTTDIELTQVLEEY